MAASANAALKVVPVSKEPVKRPFEKLPWPRKSEPDPGNPGAPIVELGVCVKTKQQDIVRIVYKHFRVPGVSMEELLQEVFLAILHKNFTRSAHNPVKSSFGHYVWMVANNVCINLVQRKKRFEKESESLDAPIGSDDRRTLMDSEAIAEVKDEDPGAEEVDAFEASLRSRGMWELARYVRAARTGASPDVIREAMSFGGRRVSTKNIRDIRDQLRTSHRDWRATGDGLDV
jgi:DNA-directed RNA polymerase specialized sigma24 family protein